MGQAVGIGEDLDGGDLSGGDGEGHDGQRAPVGDDDDAGGAVDERRLREGGEPAEGDRLLGDGPRAR